MICCIDLICPWVGLWEWANTQRRHPIHFYHSSSVAESTLDPAADFELKNSKVVLKI